MSFLSDLLICEHIIFSVAIISTSKIEVMAKLNETMDVILFVNYKTLCKLYFKMFYCYASWLPWLCSGVTSGSVINDHSWWCSGNHVRYWESTQVDHDQGLTCCPTSTAFMLNLICFPSPLLSFVASPNLLCALEIVKAKYVSGQPHYTGQVNWTLWFNDPGYSRKHISWLSSSPAILNSIQVFPNIAWWYHKNTPFKWSSWTVVTIYNLSGNARALCTDDLCCRYI